MAGESFYRDLPAFAAFADVCESQHYRPVPDDWDLVVTDVEGSTEAIAAGRYKDVNSAGVASIVAVRNAMVDVDIPYVFGGDGATLLTPKARREELYIALRGLREACRKTFNLRMRVGVVAMSQLREAGYEMEVARFAASEDVCFAMLRGPGVDMGEEWVKDPKRGAEFHVSEEGESSSSFEGFQCRWRPIPSRNGVAVSLIVKALVDEASERADVYRRVLAEISALAQVIDEGRPVARRSLKLKSSRNDFDTETSLMAGDLRSPEAGIQRKKIKRQVRNANLLMKTRVSAGGFNPRAYKREVVANTDFRKFDNVLRMHLDLRRGQLERLKEVLQRWEDDGYLVYGIHTADHTLMTCVVDSYQGSHAHFVDGGAGGYALAAKRIKAVLREIQPD